MLDNQEKLCLSLLGAVLLIIYFSPNYVDYFENCSQYVPQIPAPNIQWLKNQNNIIVNGYQPSIIRPLNLTDWSKGSQCSWPMYSKDKNQSYCSEENAIKYYAMRPLVTPTTYNEWLKNMFSILANPGGEVNKLMNSKLIPTVGCGDAKKDIMVWLMKKIAVAVDQIPAMKKNSTWGNEQFHYTDEEVYGFETSDGKSKVYKVIFNLYNPLRSTSTLVEVVVIKPFVEYIDPNYPYKRGLTGGQYKEYVIAKMDFVNKGEWNSTDTNLPPVMQGYNLPKANGDLLVNLNSTKETDIQEWNYMNTLNKQKFNSWGYYDKDNNVKIEAGVPDSLKNAIKKHNTELLLAPADIQFKSKNDHNPGLNVIYT